MAFTPATCSQAGIAPAHQYEILLRFLANQRIAQTNEIYRAFEKELNERDRTLSPQGENELRELVNRRAVNKGWIRKVPIEEGGGWSITDEGQKHLQSLSDSYLEGLLPEEVQNHSLYTEGAIRTVHINAYERSREGRDACIKHYGLNCMACGFHFEREYGAVAAGLIHVHHLTLLASKGEEYVLDPVADLRPVCANCHAVIHRREPPYSIEEVQEMLRTARIHN